MDVTSEILAILNKYMGARESERLLALIVTLMDSRISMADKKKLDEMLLDLRS